jgi:hypothetical protein
LGNNKTKGYEQDSQNQVLKNRKRIEYMVIVINISTTKCNYCGFVTRKSTLMM